MDNDGRAMQEIEEIFEKLERDRNKVEQRIAKWVEDNNWKGLDHQFMGELKQLTVEAFKQRDEILVKYGLPIPK